MSRLQRRFYQRDGTFDKCCNCVTIQHWKIFIATSNNDTNQTIRHVCAMFELRRYKYLWSEIVEIPGARIGRFGLQAWNLVSRVFRPWGKYWYSAKKIQNGRQKSKMAAKKFSSCQLSFKPSIFLINTKKQLNLVGHFTSRVKVSANNITNRLSYAPFKFTIFCMFRDFS